MRLLILLITLITISLCNGIEYINFIPYSTKECIGKERGIGYSMTLSNCLTIDFKENFIFTQLHNNIIEWNSFENKNKNDNSGIKCIFDDKVIISTFKSKIGSCIPHKNMKFNSKNKEQSTIEPIYYKLLLTREKPYISDNSYVNSFMGKKSVLFVEYFTNQTTVISNSTSTKYYCEGKIAYTQNCDIKENKCLSPQIDNIDNEDFYKNQINNLGSGSSGSTGGEISSTSGSTSGISSGGGVSSGGGSGSGGSTGGEISSTSGSSGVSSGSGGEDGEITTATSATSGGAASGDYTSATSGLNLFINNNYKINGVKRTSSSLSSKSLYCYSS